MDAFKEKLNEIRRIIEGDKYRKRVLLLCQQSEPRSFDDYSSSGSFRRLEKFESSTYSEVLKAVDLENNNKPVVMKIMRALSKGVIKRLPSVATKGCQAYNDILNELVVTQALSQFHQGVLLNGTSLYMTQFFCFIHEIKVVSGNLERAVRKSQSHSSGRITHHSKSASSKNNHKLSTLNVLSGRSNKSVISNDKNLKKKDSNNDDDDDDLDNLLKPENIGDDCSGQKSDDEYRNLSEDDRMLMEALPYEYVVTVMKHDGQPLWWWMTHKKITALQLASVLVQVIIGLAIAEKVYLYEHRDLHVSNILIKKTSKQMIPFVLEGNKFNVLSKGIKATIIDATFSRLTHNGKVYYRELTSTLRAYGTKKTPNKMSLQNRSYRQMVQLTGNNWDEFTPKTNLIWLTYLCETLMKSEILRSHADLFQEFRKIRDYTLKVNTTLDLLSYFPFHIDTNHFSPQQATNNTTKTTIIKELPNQSSETKSQTEIATNALALKTSEPINKVAEKNRAND